MTAYAAIQNPTDWNFKKCMEELENKGKAKSHGNNKLQNLPPHTDILNDVIQHHVKLRLT